MNKSTKSFTVFGLVILFFLIAYFGVYSQWTKLGEARAEYEITKKENERLKKVEAELNAFVDLYNRNQNEAERANRVLPLGEADLPNLLDMYSRISSESGLLLRTINFSEKDRRAGEEPTPQTIQSIDMEMELSGTYEAFKEYMLRVQRNLRLSDIVRINVSLDQEAGTEGRVLIFNLTIRTYYQAN